MTKRSSKRQPLTSFTAWQFFTSFTALACGFLLFGIVVTTDQKIDAHASRQHAIIGTNKANQHANQAVAATSDTPATTPPSTTAVESYQVPPDNPRYLIIPKLGVHARVIAVGVSNDGSIATPANVFDTAWFSGSALPGNPGAALIDGHVSSWTTHGVFYNLPKLTAGDTFSVEKGDGSVISYQVVRTQVYDANNVDMQALLRSVDETRSGLNLISCTGQVINGTNDFNNRVVVYSVQI